MIDSAYKGLTEVEQIFKSLVWDTALTAGETALIAQVPFLGLPIVRTITHWMVTSVSNWIYSALVLFVDVEAIKLVNAIHQAEYDSASEQLKIIAIDKGINSDDFKKARDDAKVALSRFTNIGQ